MPNMDPLKMAEDHIKSELGTLDGLPKGLANTIANVHYKFYINVSEMVRNSKREFLTGH